MPPNFIEPVWEQFGALLPERLTNHLLGCHRTRISDRVIFEKLVQVLVFGCTYWWISDKGCSATTLRRRRDEWIEFGAMDALERGSSGKPTTGSSVWSSPRWRWTLHNQGSLRG